MFLIFLIFYNNLVFPYFLCIFANYLSQGEFIKELVVKEDKNKMVIDKIIEI